MLATQGTVGMALGSAAAGSWLDGIVEADPWIAAVLIGAIVVAAVVFVWMRVTGSGGGSGGSGGGGGAR